MSEHDAVTAQLIQELETCIDDHAALVKHCLRALEAAAVPLDCRTAGAMRQLADGIESIIHAHLHEDGDDE